MEEIIRDEHVDVVVFSYSDVKYETLMHLASRAVAAGADFWLLGASAHTIGGKGAGHLDLRRAHRLRKEPGVAQDCLRTSKPRLESRGGAASDALRRFGRATRRAVRDLR